MQRFDDIIRNLAAMSITAVKLQTIFYSSHHDILIVQRRRMKRVVFNRSAFSSNGFSTINVKMSGLF